MTYSKKHLDTQKQPYIPWLEGLPVSNNFRYLLLFEVGD